LRGLLKRETLHLFVKEIVMSVDWTETHIEFVRILWNEGIAATPLCEAFVQHFHIPCTPNAIIGKVHRLRRSHDGWQMRPSPIKRGVPVVPTAPPDPGDTFLPLPSLSCVALFVDHPPPACPPPLPTPDFAMPDLEPIRYLRCEARDPNQPLFTRDGRGCQWPIGTPGTKDFRFCNKGLSALGKSYCQEHANLSAGKKPH
jgi:GcrA cell cycle regulator